MSDSWGRACLGACIWSWPAPGNPSCPPGSWSRAGASQSLGQGDDDNVAQPLPGSWESRPQTTQARAVHACMVLPKPSSAQQGRGGAVSTAG